MFKKKLRNYCSSHKRYFETNMNLVILNQINIKVFKFLIENISRYYDPVHRQAQADATNRAHVTAKDSEIFRSLTKTFSKSPLKQNILLLSAGCTWKAMKTLVALLP